MKQLTSQLIKLDLNEKKKENEDDDDDNMQLLILKSNKQITKNIII